MIRLVLPYPMSANRYWESFVPPGSRRAIVHLSTEAKQFKRDLRWLAASQGVRTPLQGRLAVFILLIPQAPQDAAKRAAKQPNDWDMGVRCIDVDNANKVTLDALKGIAFEDDSQIHHLATERAEPGNAGMVVEIEPWVPKWLRQESLFTPQAVPVAAYEGLVG